MVVETKVLREEKSEGTLGWYLCPKCSGAGEVQSDIRRKTFRGIMTVGLNICPTCQRAGMVRILEGEAKVQGLTPIEQCRLCKNWYAFGKGKPADEPCFQEHAERSHCHWHDLSIHPPPMIKV